MIYLLEDDENIRKLIMYTLQSQGMEVRGFERPSKFQAALEESLPELVLMDVMLPEESGLDVLKRLRNLPRTKQLPVIILTARSSEYDKVLGLDSGADDYIPKPFGMMELVARIRAVLRRSHVEKDEFHIDDLYVSAERHLVLLDGKEIVLTFKEFELLCLLLKVRGKVLTRDQLLNQIWGYSFDGTSRTVDVHIRSLRQKLGRAGNLIETVRGVGYRIGKESHGEENL